MLLAFELFDLLVAHLLSNLAIPFETWGAPSSRERGGSGVMVVEIRGEGTPRSFAGRQAGGAGLFQARP